MTTNYRRGRDFEYRCRRALEQTWPYVLRSAGSHTKIDLLALKRNHVPVAVQCKRDGRLAVDEWNRFYELCTTQIGAFPVLACAEDKERGRGLEWWHITGKREPGSRSKPMERWEPR